MSWFELASLSTPRGRATGRIGQMRDGVHLARVGSPAHSPGTHAAGWIGMNRDHGNAYSTSARVLWIFDRRALACLRANVAHQVRRELPNSRIVRVPVTIADGNRLPRTNLTDPLIPLSESATIRSDLRWTTGYVPDQLVSRRFACRRRGSEQRRFSESALSGGSYL